MINHGTSLMVIAQRLGHSSIEEVSTRYGHLYPSTQKEIVKYLWGDEMKDTYSEDEKIHDIIPEIHIDKNEIVLYKNIAS